MRAWCIQTLWFFYFNNCPHSRGYITPRDSLMDSGSIVRKGWLCLSIFLSGTLYFLPDEQIEKKKDDKYWRRVKNLDNWFDNNIIKNDRN